MWSPYSSDNDLGNQREEVLNSRILEEKKKTVLQHRLLLRISLFLNELQFEFTRQGSNSPKGWNSIDLPQNLVLIRISCQNMKFLDSAWHTLTGGW